MEHEINKEVVKVAVFAIANDRTKAALLDMFSGVLDCNDEGLLDQAEELVKKLTDNLKEVVEHTSVKAGLVGINDLTISRHVFEGVPITEGVDICSAFIERLTKINCRGTCFVIKNDTVTKIAATQDLGKLDFDDISWSFTDLDIIPVGNCLEFQFLANSFRATLH